MWCSRCQQDVPGIASCEDEGSIRCARCGDGIGPVPHAKTSSDSADSDNGPDHAAPRGGDWAEGADRRPFSTVHDWETDDQLRAAESLLSAVRAGGVTADAAASSQYKLDSAHASLGPWHVEQAALHAPAGLAPRGASPQAAEPRTSLFSWLVLSLGLMSFVCGAVLMGWSMIHDRADLWRLGLPLMLGGQAGLVVGLILQLDGLWHNNRKTKDTLDELDGRLAELNHATSLLGTTRSSAAQSFYAHIAEGASPQLLLADLKGQLDVLAVQLARHRAP